MKTKAKPRPLARPAPSPAASAAVAALVFLVFLPILRFQFVSWDDDGLLYQNFAFRGLGWTQLKWMLTNFHMGPYQPIAWLSYAVDYSLWGMDPMGFHLTALLLHCVNAVLLFFLGRRLLGSTNPEADASSLDLAAAAGALLFALHPLRAEPVAWASARRDLLSGAFFLCALISHLRADDGAVSGRRRTLVFYVLSLLAKPMAIGLPLVLVVLDSLVLGRGARWKEKIPYLLPAAAVAALTIHGQRGSGSTASAAVFGPLQRLAQAAYAHAFYLVKTVWPEGLAPMYERLLRLDPFGPIFLGAAAAGLALAAAAFALRRRQPGFLAAWLSYLILLAPVLGVVKYGSQLVADRYSYLPAMSWSLLAAGILLRLMVRSPSQRRGAAAGTCLLLLVLAGLTRRQAAYWRDSESLYRRVLALDPAQAVARNNLGNVLAAKGRAQEAVEQYRLALQARPRYGSAHNNLGAIFLRAGRLDEAEAEFREAVSCDPGQPDPYNNLALISASRKRYDEALDLFASALRADPGYIKAAQNREVILRLRDAGRKQEATP